MERDRRKNEKVVATAQSPNSRFPNEICCFDLS
jgi:hypothetical protein